MDYSNSDEWFYFILYFYRRNKPVNVSIRDSEQGVISLSLQKQSINTLIYW